MPWAGVGLLRANESWSGHYKIGRLLWVSAHWGQFTKAGWFFLQHGSGVRLLDNGGSYVSLTDPAGQHLTIIVETMDRDRSQCAHSSTIHYTTTNQTATFQLDNSFDHIKQLYVFYTDLNVVDVNQAFTYHGVLNVTGKKFQFQLPVGVLYTISTINGTKGSYNAPPSMPFPLPYFDNFDQHRISSEAPYFSDQAGSWEVFEISDNHNKTMRQMVTEKPISWCEESAHPYSVIGNSTWERPLNVTVDVMIENTGMAFVALSVDKGGCSNESSAIVFSIHTHSQEWKFTASTAVGYVYLSGHTSVTPGTWYTLTLVAFEDHSIGYINGRFVGQSLLGFQDSPGWAAIGSSWDYVQFDNFHLQLPNKNKTNYYA